MKQHEFLHSLEMKYLNFTVHPSTLKDFKRRFIQHLILPFKELGLFGFCSHCSKFKFNLVKNVIDTDYDEDEEGTHAYPICGMVCSKCDEELDNINDDI